MKEDSISDALLRQFLLGKVDDEERQRIESLFLTDSTIRDRVSAVEHDLVDEYLEDSFSPGDREAFLLHYAQTPEQERRLRITKSIKDWALTESETTAVTDKHRLIERLRARPFVLLPIAAVILLGVVLTIVWFNQRLEQRRQLAIDQEVARLNDPSRLRDVPLSSDALTLSPGTLRTAERQSELKLLSDVPNVEFRLLWQGRESHSTYRAVVRRFDLDRPIASTDLHLEADGKTIRLRLPSHILTRGTYLINLTGITGAGRAADTAEYQFTVVG